MDGNEIWQRFDQVSANIAVKALEIVANKASARIVFRETSEMVKGRRRCSSALIAVLGWFETIMLSGSIAGFVWLLIPFAAIGYAGVRWSGKQDVAEHEKTVYLKIDAQRRRLLVPDSIVYKPHTYRELNLNEIVDLTVWAEHNDGIKHSLRCTYGKDEETVVLLEDKSRSETECCARLLEFLFGKKVWKRDVERKIYPLKTDDLFSASPRL